MQDTEPHIEAKERGACSRRVRDTKVILIVSFICLCFTLLVYAPGYMSWDSFDQLEQARSGVFKDNHPPLMAAIWSVVDRICAGPFGMLLLQTLLFWGGLALFYLYMPGPVALRVIAVVVTGLYPPIFGLIGTVWKDLLMIGALMVVLGLAARFERRRTVGGLLSLMLFALVACGARHNAIIALPPLFVWLAHSLKFVKKEKRWPTFWRAFVAACVASVAVFFANSAISNRLTSVKTQLWQGLAVFDIAGISVQTGKLHFPEDLILTRSKLKLGYLEHVFNSATVAPLYREPKGKTYIIQNRFRQLQDEESLDRLATVWKDVVLENPGAYFIHRCKFFSHLIGLQGKVDTPFYGLYGPRIAKNDQGYVFHPSAVNERITAWLISLSKTMVYRVWVYLLVLIALTVVGIRMYLGSGDPLPLALTSSAILYDVAYFFVVGASNFRYSLWPILATLLCVGYLLCRHAACVQERRIEQRIAAQEQTAGLSAQSANSAVAIP